MVCSADFKGYKKGDSAGKGRIPLAGLWLEQFSEGQTFEHEARRTVTTYDNMHFSLMTMNPQPLHIDHDFAAQSEWGKPLVNSLFTLGLLIGMTVGDTTQGTTLGNLGMNDVRFPKPVFEGDTLKARTEVLAVRPSKSRPGLGIVTFRHDMLNQRDEVVATCERAALMLSEPDA